MSPLEYCTCGELSSSQVSTQAEVNKAIACLGLMGDLRVYCEGCAALAIVWYDMNALATVSGLPGYDTVWF